MAFAEGYKKFLSKSKTERLAVIESIALLEKAGFKKAEGAKSLKAGDKVIVVGQHMVNDGSSIAVSNGAK